MLANFIQPPLLTGTLPGIGGRIKEQIEDFVVEEIPAYEPCGSGEHLYLWIEKRDMGAEFFQRAIGRRLGISAGDVGIAGLKDRHAVTRQMVSVPAATESRLAQLDGDGIQVLKVSRHTNKLKPGHLRGNRFQIRIRGVSPQTPKLLPAVLEALNTQGIPNYYGTQRFGRDGETFEIGMRTIRGEGEKIRNLFLRKLALSSVQSALFNLYLGQRIEAGDFRKVISGDVMAKWPAGGMFVAENVATEQARFDAREIVTAGPIFGTKTFAAKGEAAAREEALLQSQNMSLSTFAGFGKMLLGTRRHNVIYADNLTHAIDQDTVQLSFSLPAGCYATILLREIMKNDVDADESPSSAEDS